MSSEIFQDSPILTGLPGSSWSSGRLSPTAVTNSRSSTSNGPTGEKSVAFPSAISTATSRLSGLKAGLSATGPFLPVAEASW